VRGVRLAQAGATADPAVLDDWLVLTRGDPASGEQISKTSSVPDGLAIKLFPCCYALQRPISALVDLEITQADLIRRISITTPSSSRSAR
jgi:2-methylcitrate dehydratase PrpD